MNVVKCQNGHFYDGDNYTACPHCGAGVANTTAENDRNKISRKGGLLGGILGHEKTSKRDIPTGTFSTQNSVNEKSQQPFYSETVTEPSPMSIPEEIKAASSEDKGHTIDFWGPSSQSREKNDFAETDVEASVENEKEPNVSNASAEQPVQGTHQNPSEGDSLKAVVQKASASTSGKTMGYFERVNKNASTAQTSTVSQTVQHKCNGPVVGWLVCISGNHIGQSFELGAGKNSIGRSSENSVVLCDDGGVSGNKHALIVYEPKKREFYIQPGDSSGLTYLNEEFITEITKMTKGDIVELGDTKLMFIPLCCQEFSWEEYLK